jgi:hypothetical protein
MLQDCKFNVKVKMMQQGNISGEYKLLYRSSKLLVEEEKCNLILQVTRTVLDARG